MGAVFGAVYDLFRIFRIAVPLPAGVIVAEDVIYFAFCGFMSFFLAMTVNFGQVRFFILLGELLGFLLYYLTLGVLYEMRPADYRFYPMDFPSPLETDSATGGTIAYVDWQKGRKNFWKTGKKREKSCAKEQKTLAN